MKEKLSISNIQHRSGIDKQSGETSTEYLQRVGKKANISSDTIGDIAEYHQKIRFSPNPEEADRMDVPIDEFLNKVESISQGETEKNRKNKSESDTSNEITDTDANEVQRDSVTSSSTSPQNPFSKSKKTTKSKSDAEDEPKSTTSGPLDNQDLTNFQRSRSGVYNNLSAPIQSRFNQAHIQRLQSLWSFKNIDYWVIIGILIIGAYVFLQSLDHSPLRQWDEAIYANTARHMIQDGDWLVPHIYSFRWGDGYHPFLEKPPLVFWLQGISMAIFGVTRFAVRLPVALLSIFSGILVYRFGTHLFNRRSGLIATLVIFTTPMIYRGGHGGRTGSTDVPLLFFGTLFVYLSWISLTKNRQDLLPYVGIAAGLALLTKGFNAGVFVIALAPLALWHYRVFLTRKTSIMIGATASIVAPWSLYAWYEFRYEFIMQIFIDQVLGRATGERFVSQSGTLFAFMRYRYFQTFPTHFDPWAYFLFPAAAVTLAIFWCNHDIKKPIFLLWWAVSTFGIFVLTGNHGWYIMPMFVPCALLIGKMVDSAATHNYVALVGISIGAIVMTWIKGITLGVVAILIGLVFVGLLDYLQEFAQRSMSTEDYRIGKRVIPLIMVGLITVSLVGMVPVGMGGPSYNGQEQLGQTASEEVPSDSVIAHTLRPQPFSFHAQRPLLRTNIENIDQDTSIQYALISNSTVSELSREYTIISQKGNTVLIQLE